MSAPRRQSPAVQRIAGTGLAVATIALLGGVAWAAQWTNADREAIRRTIIGQIEAFHRDAAEEAFSYAAPAIRDLFGTPENFLRMARERYAPVYRARSTVFGELLRIADEPTQEVILVDADGTSVLARYLMQKQAGGAWKILGCILLPVPGTAT